MIYAEKSRTYRGVVMHHIDIGFEIFNANIKLNLLLAVK